MFNFEIISDWFIKTVTDRCLGKKKGGLQHKGVSQEMQHRSGWPVSYIIKRDCGTEIDSKCNTQAEKQGKISLE